MFTKHIKEEIAYKENELSTLEERILDTKVQLHRIRLVVLAQEFGQIEALPDGDPAYLSQEETGLSGSDKVGTSWCKFEQQFLLSAQHSTSASQTATPATGSTASSHMGDQDSPEPSEHSDEEISEEEVEKEEDKVEKEEDKNGVKESPMDVMSPVVREPFDLNMSDLNTIFSMPCLDKEKASASLVSDLFYSPSLSNAEQPSSIPIHSFAGTSTSQLHGMQGSRFYTKRRVIVGNTSQYLIKSLRSGSESSTHKWMVYVRGVPGEQSLHNYVRAIRFFLHPSYRPHDIVQVGAPPFHLTRFGWGEFPVRVQLLFQNTRHKPVDIIHNLKLDRTHTGQQMLGAETVVDIELERDDMSSMVRPALSDLPKSRGEEIPCSPEDCLQEATQNTAGKVFEATRMPDSNQHSWDDDKVNPACKWQPIRSYMTVHHIAIPILNPSEAILLDHDYCVTVVVRTASFPPPKHEQGMLTVAPHTSPSTYFSSSPTATASLDSYLYSAASLLPLYAPPNPDVCPFAAISLKEYRQWSLPKQRANEWMRAVAVKKLVHLQMAQCPGGSGRGLALTTRRVVLWCRENGFTPLDPAMESCPGFCKYCGYQLPISEPSSATAGERLLQNYHTHCEEKFVASGGFDQLCSLTSPFKLLREIDAEIDSTKWARSKLEGDSDQCIDVEMLHPESTLVQKPSPTTPVINRQPNTPELRWVQKTAAQIGIHLSPLLQEGKVLHVVEHMVFAACVKFLKKLLRSAVDLTLCSPAVSPDLAPEGVKSLRERIIVPLHVYRAIRQQETMDFLTDEGIGFSSLEN